MTALNGKLPSSDLGTIAGTNQRVLTELVPQTNALRAAFQAHFGKPLVITDAYRDYATQVRLKAEKGSYAATPGTSNHGWGRAIDFGSRVNIENSAEYKWMKANAPRFGWFHPAWAEDNDPKNGQQEPWHWEAVVVPVSNYQSIGGGSLPNVDVSTPKPLTPLEDDDVKIIIGTNGRYLVGPNGHTSLNDYELETAMMVWGPNAGPVVNLTPDRVASALELIARVQVPRGIANSVWAATVQRGGDLVPVKQELADIKSLALGAKPSDVKVNIDTKALADAIASQLDSLSDADIQRIARAAADEQGRRLKP